jgi:phosphoglycerate dehydrogenase-like enzyme
MFHPDGHAMLQEAGDLQVFELGPSPNTWAEALKDASGVVIVGTTEFIDRSILDSSPRLRIVARCGVGYDSIDVKACTEHGVVVTTSPGNVNAVADLTFGLILSAARRIPRACELVQAGKWAQLGHGVMTEFLGEDVSGQTIGIIGFGRIGREVAKRARGFDMRVLYCDVVRHAEIEKSLPAEKVSLPDLLQSADIVAVCCLLNEETRHLIGRDELRSMKRHAILVSAARGPIIDSDALVEAIKSGWIAAAGLDVVENEPIDVRHPLIGLPNVVITPHIGAAARGANRLLAVMTAEEIARVLRGDRPINPLNPAVLDRPTKNIG